MKRTVLIADDDKQSARLMKNILTASGHDVYTVNLENALASFNADTPDILVIDPLYPKKYGIKLIETFRRQSECYILAVCANENERAAVSILDAGADEYLAKPFRSSEFSARVRAAIRIIYRLEKARGMSSAGLYICDDLTVDQSKNTVTLGEQYLHLTKNEFKILSLLCRYSGRVLTYHFIMQSVWGAQINDANGILRVNITNLRKKIEQDSRNPHYLFTENGVGYRMAENQALSDKKEPSKIYSY